MIAYIIKGIQKNLNLSYQYFVYIIDIEDPALIAGTIKVFDSLVKTQLQGIDVLEYMAFMGDEVIESVLRYTEDCASFYTIPAEAAQDIMNRFKCLL